MFTFLLSVGSVNLEDAGRSVLQITSSLSVHIYHEHAAIDNAVVYAMSGYAYESADK